jgi:hypothetical protein
MITGTSPTEPPESPPTAVHIDARFPGGIAATVFGPISKSIGSSSPPSIRASSSYGAYFSHHCSIACIAAEDSEFSIA